MELTCLDNKVEFEKQENVQEVADDVDNYVM